MSVFNVGLFKGPRYSYFDMTHGNRISMKPGYMYPIYWDYLNTGDVASFDVSNVVRMAPMLAPVMDKYDVTVDAFAVRLRSIGMASRNPWVYEDFFNLNTNIDGDKALPSMSLGKAILANGMRNGTLYESLNLPTFKAIRENVMDYLRNNAWLSDPVVTVMKGTSSGRLGLYPSTYPFIAAAASAANSTGVPVANFTTDVVQQAAAFEFNGRKYYNPDHVSGTVDGLCFPFESLIHYCFRLYPKAFPFSSLFSLLGNNFCVWYSESTSTLLTTFYTREGNYPVNILDEVYKFYKKDASTVMSEWLESVMDGLFVLYTEVPLFAPFANYFGVDNTTFFAQEIMRLVSGIGDAMPNNPSVIWPITQTGGAFDFAVVDKMIPAYPFQAYWKIISDWYINTALFDPDDFFLDNADFAEMFSNHFQLFRRYYQNDYFTSAFPNPQLGNAVGIPVNGTIVDLRNANAMQKLRERLLYAGSRFRDVLYAIFGHKTSSAIMDMSEVCQRWTNPINIDSVLQQSETTGNSPQANYAGTGLGYRSGGKNMHYVAEEPTVIMFIASITPKASYFQGIPRKFMRSNLYDYAIPQLANIGEEQVYKSELYFDNNGEEFGNNANELGDAFGYQRRNASFMWASDEVHGDFRGSLDYWHNARLFGSLPSLSEEFLQVNAEADNLNRIFAVTSDSVDHFYAHFIFDGGITRALPKHAYYDL